jgi:hypothetical protein
LTIIEESCGMRNTNAKHKDVFKLIESKMTPQSIRRSDAKAGKMLLALRLAEFRKAMKLDQSSVKGFSQPAVSKIEARADMKLSTLVEYCHGLGAELEIAATPARKRGKRFVLLQS